MFRLPLERVSVFTLLRSCIPGTSASLRDARAWGDLGHEVICEIAFRLAQPATQAEIRRLIDSDPTATFPDFSESCVLADHVRNRPIEHYINLPRDSVGLTADKCPLEKKCVLTAILDDLKVVTSKSETDANRLLALENLGHWVGDVHQPMHVSFLDDRGGNTIRVSGCARNLHAVWDRCLVEHAVGLDAVKAVAVLIETIKPEMRALWIASSPRDWANETFVITRASTTGYCVADGQSCDQPSGNFIINTEYIEANRSFVRNQLQKAGVRLAYLLDIALGN